MKKLSSLDLSNNHIKGDPDEFISILKSIKNLSVLYL